LGQRVEHITITHQTKTFKRSTFLFMHTVGNDHMND